MIIMLFVAGPAIGLAIMAWALDRFTPVPTFKQQDTRLRERPEKDETARQMLTRAVISPSTADGYRREFTALKDAEGLIHLNHALQNLLDKRRLYRDTVDALGTDFAVAEVETDARTTIVPRSSVAHQGEKPVVGEHSGITASTGELRAKA